MADSVTDKDTKQHLRMEHFVQLHYAEHLAVNLQRYGDFLLAGKLVGHKGSSGMVYLPGKGYDPMTLDPTTEADEVEVSDWGTVTGYTIITPVQYYGQLETQPFVYASVLLDGCSMPVGGQDIVNVPHTDVRVGMRVKAIWKPEEERNIDGISNRGWGGLDGVIAGFEPTGEPDALDKIEGWV
jgi:uncharacterized protein